MLIFVSIINLKFKEIIENNKEICRNILLYRVLEFYKTTIGKNQNDNNSWVN